MKLDHINLTVRDVGEASGFLKKHFGYCDLFEDGDAGMVALEDGSGPAVLLMKGSRASYPRMFHIGFDVEPKRGSTASIGPSSPMAWTSNRRRPCRGARTPSTSGS